MIAYIISKRSERVTTAVMTDDRKDNYYSSTLPVPGSHSANSMTLDGIILNQLAVPNKGIIFLKTK